MVVMQVISVGSGLDKERVPVLFGVRVRVTWFPPPPPPVKVLELCRFKMSLVCLQRFQEIVDWQKCLVSKMFTLFRL